MTKIVTQKRTTHATSANRPIVMYNALAAIFIINSFLSWFECTYNNPTNLNYFTYLKFTNKLPPFNLFIGALIISLILVALHFTKIWQNAYIDYTILFLDIIILTYMVSDKFIATNKLPLLNFIIALTFFILALAYSYLTDLFLPVSTMLMIGIIVNVIALILSFVINVNLMFLPIIIVITALIIAGAYIIQMSLAHYLTNMVYSNFQAIFHLPWLLIDSFVNR